MSNGLLTTLLAEPAVADPPRRVWRDWVLVVGFAWGAVLEALLRNDLVWAPWSTIGVALLGLTLLWRRERPLAMTAVAMGAFIVLDQLARLIEGEPVESFASAFLLIHVYALFRWASGRDCAKGSGIMLAAYISGLTIEWTGVGDAIGGAIALCFPAVIGLEVRRLSQRRQREREEVKTLERELLARELHDTVAHHVSAIAVQAQAGRVVGEQRPEAALEALAVIEAEASRTLAEMRSIVGTLREGRGAAAELTPQAGLADIASLAEGPAGTGGPHITVALNGVDQVGPTIGAALYRVAQEAITNARRHAVDATRVDVWVTGDDSSVRLVVIDDGARQQPAPEASGGYGLVGMTERAQLLGGSLWAGPDGPRGWRVDATIPLAAQR